MKTYTLKNPKALGDKDPKYGQAYWSYTHDSDTPVMFNLMEGEVHDGTEVTAETVELTQTKRGTEYHRLRKVRVSGNSTPSRDPSQPSTPPSGQIEVIIELLNEILEAVKPAETKPSLADSWSKTTEKKEQPAFVPDVVDNDIGDEPIDLSQIPF